MNKKGYSSRNHIDLFFYIGVICLAFLFSRYMKETLPIIYIGFHIVDLAEKASYFFNIPVYSRNYVPCNHEKSEITCNQLIHSWSLVKEWEDSHRNIPYSIYDDEIVHLRPAHGSSNRIIISLTSLIISLVLNSTIHTTKQIKNGFFLPDFINTNPIGNCTKTTQYKHIEITPQLLYQHKLGNNKKKHTHYIVTNVLHIGFLIDARLGGFIYDNFGDHVVYFLSNYIARIDQNIINHILKSIAYIPRSICLFTTHLRYEKGLKFFIGTDLKKVADIILPFLVDQSLIKPSVFYLESDSALVIEYMQKQSKNMFRSIVHLKGTKSGTNVFVLLMCSNKLLLTFRSTFSFLAAARSLTTAYWFSVENPGVLRFRNSQCGIASMMWESLPLYSWRLNDYSRLSKENEFLFRRFVKNTVM